MTREIEYEKSLERLMEEAKEKALEDYHSEKHHVPTKELRQKVMLLASIKLPISQIAYFINVSEKVIYNHYKWELQNGRAMVKSMIANKLLSLATEENDVKAAAVWMQYFGSDLGEDGKMHLPEGMRQLEHRPAVTAEEARRLYNDIKRKL